jgi:hypothetical protein
VQRLLDRQCDSEEIAVKDACVRQKIASMALQKWENAAVKTSEIAGMRA